MKIGIIGLGIIGSACKYGFERLGHTICTHDIKFVGSSINNILDTEICFVCVPTPSTVDGKCNVEIVEKVVLELDELKYQGIVAIKSTIIPTTTERLKKQTSLEICFVPEFLRERSSFADFMENHDLLAIGTDNVKTFDLVKQCHGRYPKNTVQLTSTEAEILKYVSNAFNGMKVVFANEIYEVCEKIGADYSKVKDSYILRGTTKDVYLDVNDNFREYSGMCLPKDIKALDAFVKELGLDLTLFETLEKENNKFKRLQ